MRCAAFVLSVAGVAVMSTGCGGGAVNLTGPDAIDKQRDGALAVFVNRKVTDGLDTGGGDRVDWKYVDIPSPGRMVVAVAFDSPERINGSVVLRDNFATLIERQELSSDRSVYKFQTIDAVRGRYYIELEATSGASVYTLGVGLNEPSFGEFDTTTVSAAPAAKPKQWKGKRRPTPEPDHSGTGTVAPVAKPDAPEPVVEPDQPAAPGAVTVPGQILRVIPLDDDAGGSLLTISLSGPDFESVRTGSRGTIQGLGANVVIRRRRARTATGYTKAEAEDVKPYKRVSFKVR